MTPSTIHKNSALRLLRRALLILTLLCLPAIAEAQKTRILPPKRPDKPAVKPKPKPAPKPKAKVPTVSEPTGFINGYGYVDLGLPSGTKWATCNVGATSPEDYGDYFAWGEISPKSTYTDENSITFGKKGIGDISGNPSMDAACANWGSSWRLPTRAEIEELGNNCTWTRIMLGRHSGIKATGPNGQSIFFPAAGYRRGSSLKDRGEYGSYWSSSPNGDDARILDCENWKAYVSSIVSCGRSVRPVSD